MKDYNDLKQQWSERSIPPVPKSGIDIIFKKVKFVRAKQIWALTVLSVTIAVLLYFFFYITAYKNQYAFFGLGIMIISLVVRIVIELIYMIKKRHLSIDSDAHTFNTLLSRYYQSRKFIHFVLTPAIFLGYIIGFWILVPAFKPNLSAFFFQYIVYSSWVIFAGLAVLIITQARKELRILREISTFSS